MQAGCWPADLSDFSTIEMSRHEALGPRRACDWQNLSSNAGSEDLGGPVEGPYSQPGLAGAHNGLCAIGRAQFSKNAVDVVADGLRTYR